MELLEAFGITVVNGMWVVLKALWSSTAALIILATVSMAVVAAAELEELQKKATIKPRQQVF